MNSDMHVGLQQEQHPAGNEGSTNLHSSGSMSSFEADRLKLFIASFSSLLSSAHTNGAHHALLPPKDASKSLSSLLSSESSNQLRDYHHHNTRVQVGRCTFPSLKMRNNHSSTKKGFENISLQEVMALNLASPIVADHTTVNEVPKLLLQNITFSFKELISSRLRVSIQAMTKMVQKIGVEGPDARILRRLLTYSNPIDITTIVTSFQVVKEDSSFNTNDPKSATRPLVFETIFDLSILGKMYTISLKAPGTITAVLSSVDYRISKLDIVFDTMSLLKAMMIQARAIVKKALKRAASITSSVTTYRRRKREISEISPPQTNQNLNSFSSTNNRTTPQENLLASYPEHLRETVEHFLPDAEVTDTVSIEGFPPNLMNTLKSLSGGDGECSNHDGGQEEQQDSQLHQGLFSWMNNEQMMLRRSSNGDSRPPGSSSGDGDDGSGSSSSSLLSISGRNNSAQQQLMNNLQGNYSVPYPLSKRNKKVSFNLDSGNQL